jgi:hypothetical protein
MHACTSASSRALVQRMRGQLACPVVVLGEREIALAWTCPSEKWVEEVRSDLTDGWQWLLHPRQGQVVSLYHSVEGLTLESL